MVQICLNYARVQAMPSDTGNQSDIIIGALYEMDDGEKSGLGKAEGQRVGYDEQITQVINEAGESISALI